MEGKQRMGKKLFHVTGDYGTFAVERLILAHDEDEAHSQTGIAETLEAAGWTVSAVDGEEWVIVEVTVDEDEFNRGFNG